MARQKPFLIQQDKFLLNFRLINNLSNHDKGFLLARSFLRR